MFVLAKPSPSFGDPDQKREFQEIFFRFELQWTINSGLSEGQIQESHLTNDHMFNTSARDDRLLIRLPVFFANLRIQMATITPISISKNKKYEEEKEENLNLIIFNDNTTFFVLKTQKENFFLNTQTNKRFDFWTQFISQLLKRFLNFNHEKEEVKSKKQRRRNKEKRTNSKEKNLRFQRKEKNNPPQKSLNATIASSPGLPSQLYHVILCQIQKLVSFLSSSSNFFLSFFLSTFPLFLSYFKECCFMAQEILEQDIS